MNDAPGSAERIAKIVVCELDSWAGAIRWHLRPRFRRAVVYELTRAAEMSRLTVQGGMLRHSALRAVGDGERKEIIRLLDEMLENNDKQEVG